MGERVAEAGRGTGDGDRDRHSLSTIDLLFSNKECLSPFPSLEDLRDVMNVTAAPVIIVSPDAVVGAYRLDGVDHIFVIEGDPDLSDIPGDIKRDTVVDPR